MLLQNLDQVATNVRSRLRGNYEKTSPYLLGCTGVAWFLEHSGSKPSNYVHSLPRICRWYKSSLLRKDNVKRKMLENLKKSDVRRVMNIFTYCLSSLGCITFYFSMYPHRQHRRDYAGKCKLPDEDAKLIEDFLDNDIVDKVARGSELLSGCWHALDVLESKPFASCRVIITRRLLPAQYMELSESDIVRIRGRGVH
ncbi:hypothetical protein Taro_007799, partial [Colocasia esculenta]|nr:hypothetical protein [Colocasia esculenta]